MISGIKEIGPKHYHFPYQHTSKFYPIFHNLCELSLCFVHWTSHHSNLLLACLVCLAFVFIIWCIVVSASMPCFE